jgi:hypothetical protein
MSMTSVFSFSSVTNEDQHPLECVFFFIHSDQVTLGSLDRAFTDRVRDTDYEPDIVVYVCPDSCKVHLEGILLKEDIQDRFQQVHRLKGAAIFSFGKDGELSEPTWVNQRREEPQNLPRERILTTVRNAGIEYLASRPGVITTAPPGSYFRNPSKGKRSYFIRAGLLCKNDVETAFLAFCLLPFVHQQSAKYNTPPNLVWVDTVGIAYIAYALVELGIHVGAFKTRPAIRSFSSYTGLQNVGLAPGENPIFLISASTSGGLANDIVAQTLKNVQPSAICTLLGSYSADFPSLALKLPEALCGPTLQDTETLREIRISGEDFLFSPGETSSVILKKSHLPKQFGERFERLQGKNIIHCFRRVDGHRPPKAFLIDSRALVEDAEFSKWLNTQAIESLSLTVKRIIYQDDPSSKIMAEKLRARVHEVAPGTGLVITSTSELEGLVKNADESVAVVAAVVGSGMSLMRITRALRNYQPNGSRHFIVGVVCTRSDAQLKQLKSNLSLAGRSLKYTVTTWCEFSPEAEPFSQYHDREKTKLVEVLAENFDEHFENAYERLTDRNRSISSEGLANRGSPPKCPFISLSNADGAFDLGDGFALWNKGYKNRCPQDVVFTVTCWLHGARVNSDLPASDRLDSGGFGQVVISPDCFLRFTDPVIQASILRCARDSELDYRSSPALSQRASEIIGKMFEMKEEASLEFLSAILLKRLRLLDKDTERLCEVGRKSLSDSEISLFLIERILDKPNHPPSAPPTLRSGPRRHGWARNAPRRARYRRAC